MVLLSTAGVLALLVISCTGLSDSDRIDVISSKVGPFSNPSETYPYYSLPFCAPEKVEHVSASLGEVLGGSRKVKTDYEILFKVPITNRRLCKRKMSIEDLEKFHKAVDEDYFFEFFIDDIPVWGYVGLVQAPSPESFLKIQESFSSLSEIDMRKYLYSHLIFSLGYHKDKLIEVNITSSAENRVDITELKPVEIDFTYQVVWKESSRSERVERHQMGEFLPATFEIHWLSIINSFVLVVLLTVFLAIILMRVLKNDFSKYMDDEDEFGEEESGWKLIHGDVFRFPYNKSLFCALLGSGSQLLATGVLLLFVAIVSTPSKNIISTILVLYAVTSPVSGYVSAKIYKQMGGFGWVWNTVMATALFPGPLCAMFSVLNTIAIYYDSSAALPFQTILTMMAFIMATLPLTILGAMLGKRHAAPFQAPCRTTKVCRQIPASPWYRKRLAQVLVAGFLPFSAIYIELHYIFASIWGHKVYTLFGVLFLAFLMLLIVTSFITIALIYFQLAVEDYRWWWQSFLLGGSTGFFVYGYSFFYYFRRSAMSGFLQTSFYFGYVFILAWTFFLVLGTVGFFSAFTFVTKIYSYIKSD